jgi:hypothetical protein
MNHLSFFSGITGCCIKYRVEQRVFEVQLYFKYESARKCRRKSRCYFSRKPLPIKRIYVGQQAKDNKVPSRKKEQTKQTVLTVE